MASGDARTKRGKGRGAGPSGGAGSGLDDTTPSRVASLRGLSYAEALAHIAPGAERGSSEESEAEASWEDVLSGRVVIEQGHSGPAVRLLQQKLTAAGFAVDTTGVFGPATARVLEAFKTGNALGRDHIIDAATAEALDGAATSAA